MTVDEFAKYFEVDRETAHECVREKIAQPKFWYTYYFMWIAVNAQYRRCSDGRLHPVEPLRVERYDTGSL